jgi:hypothetical protein
MVLRYYGEEVNQRVVLQRTYGKTSNGLPPELPTTIEGFGELTAALDQWNIGRGKLSNVVAARMFSSAPRPSRLIESLNKGRPVVVVLDSTPGRILMITGVRYSEADSGDIRAVTAVDPLLGQRTYPPSAFLARVSGYWDLGLSGSVPARALEASLSARLDYSEKEFESDISRLQVKRVILSDGTIQTGYDTDEVKEVVLHSKERLLRELRQAEFAGMRVYVEKFYPLVESSTTSNNSVSLPTDDLAGRDIKFLHARRQARLLAEAQFNKIVSSVRSFHSKLRANKKAVDLDVVSTPDGAKFEFKAEGGESRTNDTNSRVTNIFRGWYTFTLTKEGLRPITREVNLVDDAVTSIVCKIYRTEAGSCSLH